MNNGYIKLYRSFEDWYGYSSSKRVHLWIHLLMSANHKEASFLFNGKPVIVKEGQFITGRKKLSQATGISESYIEQILNEFEKQGQVRQHKSSTSRMITIVAWSDYQSTDSGEDNRPTTDRQPTDTNKNDKNDKKVIKGAFVEPSIQQITVYCNERKNKVNPNAFLAFYESKGWMIGKNKVKDWKACVRTWELRDNGQKADETPKIGYGPAKSDCGHCKGTGSIYAPGSGKMAVCGCRYPKKNGQ